MWFYEELFYGELVDEVVLWGFYYVVLFDVGVGVFEEIGVIDIGGVGGGICEVVEVVVYFVGKGGSGFEFVIGDGVYE